MEKSVSIFKEIHEPLEETKEESSTKTKPTILTLCLIGRKMEEEKNVRKKKERKRSNFYLIVLGIKEEKMK